MALSAGCAVAAADDGSRDSVAKVDSADSGPASGPSRADGVWSRVDGRRPSSDHEPLRPVGLAAARPQLRQPPRTLTPPVRGALGRIAPCHDCAVSHPPQRSI